jgi:hypothetical protein
VYPLRACSSPSRYRRPSGARFKRPGSTQSAPVSARTCIKDLAVSIFRPQIHSEAGTRAVLTLSTNCRLAHRSKAAFVERSRAQNDTKSTWRLYLRKCAGERAADRYHSSGVKRSGREPAISKSPDTNPQLSTLGLLAKPYSGRFVCGVGFIPRHHDAPLLLIPTAVRPKLYLILIHDGLPDVPTSSRCL